MKSNHLKCLIAIIAVVFVLPAGFIYAQSVGDALNPFVASPSACGVSGEGLCQSSCGPYDDIISASNSSGEGSYCSKSEQCCVPTKCGSNFDGIGDCKNVTSCGEGTIGKNTSDCAPPKLCCIMPKITEITCPGGVCSEDNVLNESLSSVCVEGFTSDFCEEYASSCGQDPNSLMCQQTLIDLTNNATVSACSGSSQLSDCLRSAAACSKDQNSSDCQQVLVQNDYCTSGQVNWLNAEDIQKCLLVGFPGQDLITNKKGLVPCEGFNCTLCSIFQLIKNIIDWLVGFILAISVGFIVWAGIQMMFSGGDSGAVTKARETATTAIYGVAIALSGWLIIGTLLGILTGSDKIMPWNKITCTSASMNIGTEVAKPSANCVSAGGICQNKTTALCAGGTYKSGLCAGSVDIQCCVPN